MDNNKTGKIKYVLLLFVQKESVNFDMVKSTINYLNVLIYKTINSLGNFILI